ncbi:hypothetical protein VTJ83DRAFT_1525 [Remersonia thermophila]|uniref:BZIP domain-containing protein n=1 Tax=Remersonia thermophila TaxID=72144 RepID=A0ABR4DG73_9PEZI
MSEIPAWSGAPSPAVKFEGSPAESMLSAPDEMYPSLFSASPASTINPLDVLSPPASTCGDSQPSPAPSMSSSTMTPSLTPSLTPALASGLPSDLSMLAAGITALTQTALTAPPPPAPTSEAEKKPVKKRKSWGQVLPEPKTNLPPRKRAKTEDEKEQRRVERVLRNRRAAQSSRERKRLEVEGLERRNKQLEAAVIQLQQVNLTLLEELQKIRQNPSVASSASFDGLRQAALTLSQQLFASQGGQNTAINGLAPPEPFNANKTVNPASLSPGLNPIPEAAEEQPSQPAPAAAPAATATTATAPAGASPDATQHPAEMLCPDLQCRSAEAPASPWQKVSQQALHPVHLFLLQLQFLLAATSAAISACQRPLTQIAISLRAGSSLPPTPAILNTIIWLVTTPYRSPSRPTSTSTSSSPTPAPSSRHSLSTAAPSQTRPSSTLRLRTLRKILTCSPTLARPLMDATMAVLRLASTEAFAVDRVSGADGSAAAPASGDAPRPLSRRGSTGWLQGAALPSTEALLTLLWVLRVEERRLEIRNQVKKDTKASDSPKPGTALVLKTPTPTMNKTTTTTKYVLKVSQKRSREAESIITTTTTALKKRRFS